MTTQIFTSSPFEKKYGFSRGIRTGKRICISGTAPIEPDGSSTVGDVQEQTRRCLTIIESAINDLGGTLSDVIRTRMFITSRDDADAVGSVHGNFFSETRPVATMVIVAALLEPEWKVEIEAEAVVGRAQ